MKTERLGDTFFLSAHINKSRKVGFFLLLLMLSFPLQETWALQSQKLNLEKMTKQSDRIIEGKVVALTAGTVLGPNGGEIPVMEYTLSVSNALKGEKETTVVVKHLRLLGVSSITGQGGSGRSGFPTYKVGEHLILFLTRESRLGLSSPVGLQQGVFQVQEDEKGQPTHVVNGMNNVGLYDGVNKGEKMIGQALALEKAEAPSISEKAGPIAYSQFVSEVSRLVGQK